MYLVLKLDFVQVSHMQADEVYKKPPDILLGAVACRRRASGPIPIAIGFAGEGKALARGVKKRKLPTKPPPQCFITL